MKKWGVFDNGKPASMAGFLELRHSCWATHEFDTYGQALKYAQQWLGEWWDEDLDIEPNEPTDYSGYGDMIEIRKLTYKEARSDMGKSKPSSTRD